MEYNILHSDNKQQQEEEQCASSITINNNKYNEYDSRENFYIKFKALALGNFLEYYDFAIFGSLIDIISENFFPEDQHSAFTLSLAIYGSAFLMRPIGGVFIGYIGDHWSRKRALEISICLMIIPSFAMGCLPTYHQLGFAMTFLLVIMRLCQGLAVGGELIGAFIMTLESSYSASSPGFYGAVTKSSCFCGSATGMGLVALLRIVLTHDQMMRWGWRLPFLLGILFGALGYYYRMKLKEETEEEFENEENTKLKSKETSKDSSQHLQLLRNHSVDILLVIIVASFWGTSYYICCIWITYYLRNSDMIGEGKNIGESAFLVNFIITLVMILIFPLAGWIGDIIGNRETMMLGTLLMIFSALPAMWLITNLNLIGLTFGLLIWITSISLFGANLPAFMVFKFSQKIRYLAIGISYNISNAIFASSAPMIATFLIHSSNRQSSSSIITTLLHDSAYRPCYYLIIISIIVLITLALVPIIDKKSTKLVNTIHM